MSLRVNTAKLKPNEYLHKLTASGIEATPIPYTHSGLQLDRSMDPNDLPGFSAGEVSVQDGGAQLAAELFELQPGDLVLDACAAPGGKTGHLLERFPDIQLTAIDLDPKRLLRVEENLQRLGLDARLYQGDASAPEGGWCQTQYDAVLLDAPCSASGVIQRQPDVKYLRQASDIDQLKITQANMLESMWGLLKPGGTLLYVTCSIFPDENQSQIKRFTKQHPDAQLPEIQVEWGIPLRYGRQIIPGHAGMDGFYYAKLIKAPS